MKHLLPVAAIMTLHTVFVQLDLYSVPHLDSVMHLLGGVALGILVSGQLAHAASKNWCPDPGRILVSILIVTLVATGAVFWEIYEWLSDRFIGTYYQLTVDDTIKDLVLGLAGGLLYACIYFISNAYEAQLEVDSAESDAVRSGS